MNEKAKNMPAASLCEVLVRLAEPPYEVQVLAYDAGQLVVHHSVGTLSIPAPWGDEGNFYSLRPITYLDRWTVSHKRSGYLVVDYLSSLERALVVAGELAGCDFDSQWDGPEMDRANFKPDKSILERVTAVRMAHRYI